MFSYKNLIVVVIALYLIFYVLKDETQKMTVGGSAILFLCMGNKLLEGLEDLNQTMVLLKLQSG